MSQAKSVAYLPPVCRHPGPERGPQQDPCPYAMHLAVAAIMALIQTLPCGTGYFIGVVLIVMMTGRLSQTKGSLARAGAGPPEHRHPGRAGLPVDHREPTGRAGVPGSPGAGGNLDRYLHHRPVARRQEVGPCSQGLLPSGRSVGTLPCCGSGHQCRFHLRGARRTGPPDTAGCQQRSGHRRAVEAPTSGQGASSDRGGCRHCHQRAICCG